MQYNKPYPIERLLSAGTYLSVGFVGFVWLIIAALLRKQVRPFLMYHILQSIFLSFLFFIVSILAKLIYNIFAIIPFLNKLSTNIFLILNVPMVFNLSIIQCFTTTIILYLAITSAIGLYSYLPWISDIIKGNTR